MVACAPMHPTTSAALECSASALQLVQRWTLSSQCRPPRWPIGTLDFHCYAATQNLRSSRWQIPLHRAQGRAPRWNQRELGIAIPDQGHRLSHDRANTRRSPACQSLLHVPEFARPKDRTNMHCLVQKVCVLPPHAVLRSDFESTDLRIEGVTNQCPTMRAHR